MYLDGLIVATIDEKQMTKFGHMYGEDPKVILSM
jgi:hypothetical protein